MEQSQSTKSVGPVAPITGPPLCLLPGLPPALINSQAPAQPDLLSPNFGDAPYLGYVCTQTTGHNVCSRAAKIQNRIPLPTHALFAEIN